MARTLILVRHGKAERASAERPDRERSLVAGAREALAAAYPATFALLRGTGTAAGRTSGSEGATGTAADTATDPEGATGTAADTATDPSPALVWVSPALRTRQTAEEVMSALDANGIAHAAPEPHECLWEQDGSVFLAELQATPDDATVVVVGHVPFVQAALARLTGADLPFAPGAMACAELGAGVGAGSGRLLWFVQGPSVS